MESTEQMIERLIKEVQDQVYAACLKPYEEAEHAGIIVGNGHHVAQEAAKVAGELLRRRFRDAEPRFYEVPKVNAGEPPTSNE